MSKDSRHITESGNLDKAGIVVRELRKHFLVLDERKELTENGGCGWVKILRCLAVPMTDDQIVAYCGAKIESDPCAQEIIKRKIEIHAFWNGNDFETRGRVVRGLLGKELGNGKVSRRRSKAGR